MDVAAAKCLAMKIIPGEAIRMRLTGHSSKAMNAQYTHMEVATLKNAMTALPLFGARPDKYE